MRMGGEQRISAPRAKVWDALNDPKILKECIPGCQSLEKIADDRMKAVAAVKVGPIGARFTGEVTLGDLDPPNGYRIQGEGQGGAAGFASGGATVRLEDDGPDATILRYEVDAQVGGRLAQLGGALIDATAKQMAGMFFKRFSEAVTAEAAAPPSPAETPAKEAEPAAPALERTAMPAAPVAAPAPSAGLFWPSVLALLAAAAAGFLFGRGATGWDGSGAWAGLAVGLAIVLTAGAAFGFGRKAGTGASPVILLDADTLARIAETAARSKAN